MQYQQPMVLGVPAAPNASQASLRADRSYITMLEAESTWPMKYTFSRPNPMTPRAFPVQGLNAPAIGPGQVATFNRLLPQNFRIQNRASQHRLQTELFGTAPYVALGRGILQHVDVSTGLIQGHNVSTRGSRWESAEKMYDRKAFIDVPRELRELEELRMGTMTRVAPSYAQPHDP